MGYISGFPSAETGSMKLSGRAFAPATTADTVTTPRSLRLATLPVDKRPRPSRRPLAVAIFSIVLMSSLGWAVILGMCYLL
jgi:hypothetical protein